MCCTTHDVRDQIDAQNGVAIVLAEIEDFRCKCPFGSACRRRATGEDFRCDWCRTTVDANGDERGGHQEWCNMYLGGDGYAISPQAYSDNSQVAGYWKEDDYSFSREPVWQTPVENVQEGYLYRSSPPSAEEQVKAAQRYIKSKYGGEPYIEVKPGQEYELKFRLPPSDPQQ
jgi:hypothetical protein